MENGNGQHDTPAPQFTAELRDTQRSARALLALVDHDALTDLEGGSDVLESLEQFAQAKIPTARALARAALVGAIESHGIYILWTRARKAFMAAAPAVMDMFLEKMEKGHDCKYSERLLVEAMKGTGMLTVSEPVSDEDRQRMITDEELKQLSDEELRERLNRTTRRESD